MTTMEFIIGAICVAYLLKELLIALRLLPPGFPGSKW